MANFAKRALADKLKEMLRTKSLDKITVKDLVEACDLNRQTFYYHFQDMYDLLAWIYITEAVSTIENNRTYTTWQQGIIKILEYVKENAALCTNTYRSLAREHIERFLNEVLSTLIGDVVYEIAKPYNVSDDHIQFITRFYGYAFSGILLDWIGADMKTPCKEIADNISITAEGCILAAVKRFEKSS